MQASKLNGVKITGPTCTKSLGVAASARRNWTLKRQGCSQSLSMARNYHAAPRIRPSIASTSKDSVSCTRETPTRFDSRSPTEGPSNRRTFSTSPTRHGSLNAVSRHYVPRFNTTSTATPRRTSLTAGEGRALEEMFSAIYQAAKLQERQNHKEEQEIGSQKFTILSQQETSSERYPAFSLNSSASLLTSTKPIEVRWVRAGDEILDIKKEEIDLCQSDHDLHNWVIGNLFDPFKTHDIQLTSSVPALPSEAVAQTEPLPAYVFTQLLSVVMRTFRNRYKDPHAALAVFDHVRNASVASYVACCGTAAYNELIETEWDSFRNLRGVYEALEEMKLNKVRIDTRTQALVEQLRHQVGNHSTWQEDGFGESPIENLSTLEKIEGSLRTAPTSQHLDREEVDRRSGAKWKVGTKAWKFPSMQTKDALELV